MNAKRQEFIIELRKLKGKFDKETELAKEKRIANEIYYKIFHSKYTLDIEEFDEIMGDLIMTTQGYYYLYKGVKK